MKRILIILGVVVLLAAVAIGGVFAVRKLDRRIAVRTRPVQRVEQLVSFVACSGEIRAAPKAKLQRQSGAAPLQAEMLINEIDITRVKVGQKAHLTVDLLADLTTLTARVEEIGAAALKSTDRAGGNDFRVVLTVDPLPERLAAGMKCEAEITIDTRQNALTVPIAALMWKEAETSPGPLKSKAKGARESMGVYVKDAESKAQFLPVKFGLMSDMMVEVVDGLKEGDEVIIGPLASLRQITEGSPLKEEKTEETGIAEAS